MSKSPLKRPRQRSIREGAPHLSILLRRLRTEAQLTQADAADKIGVALATLSRTENGDLQISANKLEKILNFYDMTLSAQIKDQEPIAETKLGSLLPKW